MRRNDLIKHLEKHGCQKLREGAKHTMYLNTNSGDISTIPRHVEINKFLAKKICKDLSVPIL
jgi:mRNA interferase HicA